MDRPDDRLAQTGIGFKKFRGGTNILLAPPSQKLLMMYDIDLETWLNNTIEEIKTTCTDCDKKAVFNIKMQGNQPELDGPVVELGFEEKYLPVCAECYQMRHSRYLRYLRDTQPQAVV
jgi:hypothetical protein